MQGNVTKGMLHLTFLHRRQWHGQLSQWRALHVPVTAKQHVDSNIGCFAQRCLLHGACSRPVNCSSRAHLAAASAALPLPLHLPRRQQRAPAAPSLLHWWCCLPRPALTAAGRGPWHRLLRPATASEPPGAAGTSPGLRRLLCHAVLPRCAPASASALTAAATLLQLHRPSATANHIITEVSRFAAGRQRMIKYCSAATAAQLKCGSRHQIAGTACTQRASQRAAARAAAGAAPAHAAPHV